jgi:hypothetical protein
MGDANLVFNPALRSEARDYVAQVFADLGTDFFAVRVGGGRFGELTYPPAKYGDVENNYWAFDANAALVSPAPGWRHGEPSHHGEAAAFLHWYLDRLVEFQNWQIQTVRANFDGSIMVLYPSWGIRPGQIEAALAANLDGSTSAEINGEIQRGFDFARQVSSVTDPMVIVTTTWLNADDSGDDGTDPRYWSPVKYLAELASAHPLRLAVYGENSGGNDAQTMQFCAEQVRRHGLIGMAWFREDQLFTDQYASLEDYRKIIVDYGR